MNAQAAVKPAVCSGIFSPGLLLYSVMKTPFLKIYRINIASPEAFFKSSAWKKQKRKCVCGYFPALEKVSGRQYIVQGIMDSGVKKIIEREIVLRGRVEGVGMRPALYVYSCKHSLSGYAANLSGCVHLVWQGEKAALDTALEGLAEVLPPGSSLEEGGLQFCDRETGEIMENFRILSGTEADMLEKSPMRVNLLTPPDCAPCEKCLAEMDDLTGRRFRHAFNACAECGPRTSVIRELPYDRERSSWREFPLCPDCRAEYEAPDNRRFHIEGISCPVCGPQLELHCRSGEKFTGGEVLEQAAAVLKSGGLLASKGVGGFQLLCDAENAAALAELRRVKHRPAKPLALMAFSIAAVKRFFEVGDAEEKALVSPAAPIVLLRWRKDAGVSRFHPELTAPDGAGEAGVMLAASPLHYLLMKHFEDGLLAVTSGNISGAVPALSNAEAAEELGSAAGALLCHDRDITERNDDSLLAVNGGKIQLWRRARGYSRAMPWRLPRRVLALGALWKNTFVLCGKTMFMLSSHHGDLEDFTGGEKWEAEIRRILRLSGERPEAVAVDMHPDYYSSIFGRRLAQELDAELSIVPHHYAHALAGLLESGRERALALVFDGTGLGPDGKLWGGELLEVSLKNGGRRLGALSDSLLPGGELAVKEAWRQCAARLFASGCSLSEVSAQLGKVDETALGIVYSQCMDKWNAPSSSSAGRLFDAASVLFGAAEKRISYEGQNAVRLENAASGLEASGINWQCGDIYEQDGILRLGFDRLFSAERPEAFNAFDFHVSLAEGAAEMVKSCSGNGRTPETVILTGGVFQNRLLCRLLSEKLEKSGFEVFIPQELPPNDGGISAGQSLWSGLKFSISGVNYTV